MSADEHGTGGAGRGRERDPSRLWTPGPDQVWPGSGRSGDRRHEGAGADADDEVMDAEIVDAGEPPGAAEGEGAGPEASDGEAGEAAGAGAAAGAAAGADARAGAGAGRSDELAVCVAQRDEYLDSLRRLQAEFENYKKRVIKQQGDQTARAAVSLLEKILPVLDTLDLAIEHMGDPGSVDGRALEAVSSQLRDVLAKEGLERISPIGEHFDPTAHEAVGHLPAEAESDGGDGESPAPEAANGGPGSGEPVVAEVMRAGYRWRGAVIRPAMVMVQG